MERKITISYWWKCDKIKGEIPRELQEALAESAENRIAEMMSQEYIQGELRDNVNMKLQGKRTPKDGWECYGSWQADKAFVEE